MIIDSAKYTNAGGHDINEDSYLCRGDRGIFIAADGLGGHSDGEKASMAAVDYFEENCRGGYTEDRLTELMEGANTEVLKNGDGGKTTVAAAFVENGRFIYANAGDSRVYYFHDGKIIAQTKDHSVCQASADMGLIRPEDIRRNEDRSRLLKVLGGEEKLNIKKHYPPIKIQNGDAFLVCTDGFWDYVYEAEMEADLLKSGSADVWLKYMLKRQILRAQNKGDNYTAICGIIHMDEGDVYEDIAEPAKPQSKPAAPYKAKRKLPILPIAVGVMAAAAAAAVICIFILLGKNGGEEQVNTTPEPAESVTAATEDTTTESITTTTEDTAAEITTAEAAAVGTETEPVEDVTDGGSEAEDADGSDSENEENENTDIEAAESENTDVEAAESENTDVEAAENENEDIETADDGETAADGMNDESGN